MSEPVNGSAMSAAATAQTMPRAPAQWTRLPPLVENTPYATVSPAAGESEFRAVQSGGCYYGWPFQYRNCLSCQFCPGGPKPGGYPYGPHDARRPLVTAQQPVMAAEEAEYCGATGKCSPHAPACQVGPRDWLAPAGARSVKIADPNVWSVLPNNVPPSVAINWYHHGNYISDIYANRHGPFRGCDPGRAGQCKCSGERCPGTAMLLQPRVIQVPQGYALQPPN